VVLGLEGGREEAHKQPLRRGQPHQPGGRADASYDEGQAGGGNVPGTLSLRREVAVGNLAGNPVDGTARNGPD